MTEQLPPAIIFDMDDTILSDDRAAERCFRQVCQEMCHRFQPVMPEDLLADITEVRRWYWADPERIRRGSLNLALARRELLSMAFERHCIEDDELLEEMSDAYQKLKAATIEVIPGALDTLKSLRSNGIRLGLITNGDAEGQRAKVRKAGLEPLFDSILVAGEFGVAKPDPQVFLHTLDRLRAEPQEAWMVGDNLYADIGGAQAVGIRGVWVDWRGSGLPDNTPAIPCRTIQSIVELNPENTE
ncbi:MAG: HAD family hydrolase [Chloroflexota bacterium]|nr:HAD family hydrolase [Chloroflexota bacterium]